MAAPPSPGHGAVTAAVSEQDALGRTPPPARAPPGPLSAKKVRTEERKLPRRLNGEGGGGGGGGNGRQRLQPPAAPKPPSYGGGPAPWGFPPPAGPGAPAPAPLAAASPPPPPPTPLHAPPPNAASPGAGAKPRRPKDKRDKERRRHGLGGPGGAAAAREENGDAKAPPRGGRGRGRGPGLLRAEATEPASLRGPRPGGQEMPPARPWFRVGAAGARVAASDSRAHVPAPRSAARSAARCAGTALGGKGGGRARSVGRFDFFASGWVPRKDVAMNTGCMCVCVREVRVRGGPSVQPY